MNHPCRLLLIILFSGFISLHAQEKAGSLPGGNLAAAMQLRVELAQGIADTPESARQAIARLRAVRNPSGLPVAAEADLTFAALDLAHRLLGAGKPVAAEEFFRLVETSGEAVLSRAAEDDTRTRVQFLGIIADVRGKYLNKPAAAADALAKALALRPDDEGLQYLQQSLELRRGREIRSGDGLEQKGGF